MSFPPAILTDEVLREAVAQLGRREPRFASVVDRHGSPSLRAMPQGLGSLLQIVTEQFLSLQAAHAIWVRVQSRLKPCTPDKILACSQDDFLRLGLSQAKARHFHGIATVLREQPGFLETVAGLEDEAARKMLLMLPGVGPWTAEVYLLSALLRADAWPAGDLALRASAADLFGLGGLPGLRDMARIGGPFAPWRAVAARLLWAHYRGLKGLAQAGQPVPAPSSQD